MRDIEERLQALEDKFAIIDVMTTYCLAVDADDWDRAGSLWLDDGVYVVPGSGSYVGPRGIQSMLEHQLHDFIRGNSGVHNVTYPLILVEGDHAVATSYGHTFIRDNERYEILRLSLTRWDFRRIKGDWKVARRVNELLDDNGKSRRLANAAWQLNWDQEPAAEQQSGNESNGYE